MATRPYTRRPSSGKTYVVFKGRNPGFYSSWAECEAQVSGFPGNVHKSYNTRSEAESAWLRYWSRSATFDEAYAAATTLEGAVQGDSDGSHTQDDHPTRQIQLQETRTVHNMAEYAPVGERPSGMGLKVISMGLAFLALVWIVSTYSR